MLFDVTIEIPRGSGNNTKSTTPPPDPARPGGVQPAWCSPRTTAPSTTPSARTATPSTPSCSYPSHVPGVVITVRPVGMLRMVDENGGDDKILTVPAGDDRFAQLQDITDVPEHTLAEIEHFFLSPLQGDRHGKHVTTNGWADRAAAEAAFAPRRKPTPDTRGPTGPQTAAGRHWRRVIASRSSLRLPAAPPSQPHPARRMTRTEGASHHGTTTSAASHHHGAHQGEYVTHHDHPRHHRRRPHGARILDSRGYPTVRVSLELDDGSTVTGTPPRAHPPAPTKPSSSVTAFRVRGPGRPG